MSNVKVLHNNYVDPGYFTGMTFSSQKTAMPATNLLNGVRRSKVWRSNGYWEITSSNKGIVFQKVDGTNITALIAEGIYASDSALFAAIKSALDAVGAGPTFTVARDVASGKIKITSDGAGGTIFKLVCTNAGFTSAATLGFSTAADLSGSLSYSAQAMTIHTSEFIRFDLGSSSLVKGFMLIGLRNKAIKLSQNAVVTLQANHTDTWNTPALSIVLPYHTNAMGIASDAGLGSYRYWRLKIQDPYNVNGYVEISNLFLGSMISLNRGAVQFPLEEKVIDYGELQYARGGSTFSDEVQITNEYSFTWNNLTVQEKESLKEMNESVTRSKAFFMYFDPNGVFSTDSLSMVKFCKFTVLPEYRLASARLWLSAWTIREEV